MARKKRDYYAVLGVERTASEAEIKRAFRELARKYHPDTGIADGGERFREINDAHTTLSNREARQRYDRWGHPDDSGGGFGAVVDAASEIINDVFRRRRATKTKGKNLRYTLEVTFEEAAFGASKTVTLPANPEANLPARELTVVVPAGVKDGTVKTLRGEGEPGRQGGTAGDLDVSIRVAPHAAFRRDGNDVKSETSVSYAQATLGAVIEVPTLDGLVKMKVPEGTQPGALFRIRGRGIPHAASKAAPRGDHLVTVNLTVPTELTAKQRELLEELAKIEGDKPQAIEVRPKRLLDRVRSLLDE